MSPPPLILASSSAIRRALLQRLRIPFHCYSPDIDECAHDGELPRQLVRRLAIEKAKKIATIEQPAIVIGCDQVAVLGKEALGKPGNHETAREQLQKMQGSMVLFVSATAVVNPTKHTCRLSSNQVKVKLRSLDNATIERYLESETPWDCAGSFKSECSGIGLTERIYSDDPTALMGLPLINLACMLRAEGYDIP